MVGAHVPVAEVRGFGARRVLDVYEATDGYGCDLCDLWQPGEVSEGTGRAQLRAYII